MRVLVTGHRGYIGSVVATVLRHARFEVVGLDCDLYAGCDFGRTHHPVPSFDIEVREVEFTDLLPFDAVIHLAAMPAELCDADSGRDFFGVDEETSHRLAECSKKASVARFLFASTCDVYGRVGRALCDEHYPTSPMGEAAESKLRCEELLTNLADRSFTPTILRIPEVYGVSPQMRLEPLVNEFTASAVVSGRVQIDGDASAWRSLIHVEDLARACAALLATDDETKQPGVCNMADADAAYRVVDIADAVTEQIPHVVRSTPRHAYDAPSCRADGSKFARLFPKFAFRWTLEAGIRQLASAFASAGLTPGEYRSDRYRRLMKLRSSKRVALSHSVFRRREPSAA
ncbi:MAG: SDR family oxidoreductase [Planctomycetes bacterium]|nr:SDR family oxidoreductase [Planctomycetota bacterium]